MNPNGLKDLTEAVVSLSKEIGDDIKAKRVDFKAGDVERKSFNNFVSYVDKEAEERFIQGLKQLLPEAGFIAEEGTVDYGDETMKWIIDPLDGTTNFIQGIPLYCTSVALMDGNELVLGVVYEPNMQECFHAYRGGGCMLNGIEVKVADTRELLRSLVATGFPYDDFARQSEYFEILRTFTERSRGIRRLGSAALDLAYVACGRFEGFYEYGLNSWDVAAGALLVKEAGGVVTDFKDGQNFVFGEEIIADNGSIHEEFQQLISEGFYS